MTPPLCPVLRTCELAEKLHTIVPRAEALHAEVPSSFSLQRPGETAGLLVAATHLVLTGATVDASTCTAVVLLLHMHNAYQLPGLRLCTPTTS